MATRNGWLEEISEQLWGVAEAFGAEVKQHGFFAVLRPVAPFNQPSFLVPVVTVGALVAFLLLSGVAVASLGGLLAAMLALYLIVVQVFGVSVELYPFGAGR
jgi:hypothetical protein